MNTVVNTINAAGQAFVDFALPMLIQSGVLVLILLLIDLALRRRVRAVFRYWIWILVLLKLILPPSLWSPFSFGTWFGQTLETPAAVLQETTPPMEPSRLPAWPPQAKLGDGVPSAPIAKGFALDAATPIMTPPTPQPEYDAVKPTVTPAPIQPAASLGWQALVLLAWAATVLALLLLLLQRARFVRSLVAQAQEAPPNLVATMDACRTRVGLAGPVALRISPNATSPAVCGLLRPVILIPKNLAPKLREHDLEAVLLHELAHIKRGDLWVNLIQTLLQIAYFYNPLLWLANLMIRRIREQAVDEAVLVAMGKTAGDYPETLLNVAKLAFRKRPTLSLRLIGVVESKSALSGRIKHILGRPFPKSAKLGLLGLAVVFVVAAFLLPMAKAQRHPKQISGIDENLNVSDKSGSLTIRSLHMDPPEGKRSLGVNEATLSVVVENTSDTGTYLGFEYYVDSGTIWGVYSPGASSRAQVSAVPAHWQGTLKYPIHYARFTRNGYIRILLAKCDNLRVGKFIDPEVEVLHDKKYPVFADEGLQTAESGGEPSGCVATLPNGVIVELVGVCEHPSAGKQWWQADGSPLTQSPCEYSGVLFPRPGASESAYEFVVRLANLPDGASVTLKTEPGGTGLADTRPEGLRRLSATLPGDLEQCQLFCDVAAGPWETAASSDGTLFSPLAVRSDPIVFTEGVEWNDGGVTVTVTDDLLEHPYRIVAFTKNGDIVESSQEIRFPFAKVRETTAYFRDIPRDQIAEFQLQIRPWTRARFMNVSLRPAQETHVTVHIDPPEGPAELDGNEVTESAPLPLTERAKKIMPVAEQEARRLNHSYVGTEHILLALVREKDAVSTQVLANLGADLDTLRAEVGKLLKSGSEPVIRRRLPRTPRAKRVMKYAREEARALGHNYIGTEHLLLGLMRETEGAGAQVLAGLGVDETQIRADLLTLVQSGSPSSDEGTKGNAFVEPTGDLEFRIAPNLENLDPETVDRYRRALTEGNTHPHEDFTWFPLQTGGIVSPDLIVQEHEGITHGLLWNKEPHAMLAGQAWGLEDVVKTMDDMGRRVIRLTLNEAGASLFHEITRAHARQALAIVLGSEVVSMPHIASPIAGRSIPIVGRFTNREMDKMIAVLNKAPIEGRALKARGSQWSILDLATSGIVVIPSPLSASEVQRSVRAGSQGDLAYRVRGKDGFLMLMRGATSDQAEQNSIAPFDMQAYRIGTGSPQALTVTTAEGQAYKVTILAADEYSCILELPVRLDSDTSGRATTLPPDLGPLGGHALSFDGVDDCLIVPPSPSLTLKPPFSIEMWIKPHFSDTQRKERPNMSLLVRKRKLAAPERGGYVALASSSPELGTPCWANLYYAYGGGKLAQTGRFVADGPILGHPGWFHLSLDITREDYVIAPDHPLVIGDRASPDGASFKGEIAEIRIWNRRLTNEETRYYGNIPLTGNEPGLVACWDFERSPGGQMVYDLSPNANHAHLGKTSEADGADPTWVDLTEDIVSTSSVTSAKDVDHNDLQQGLFTIRGRVTDESGRPLTGVEMLARCGFENPPLAHRTLTDQNGQYTLRFSHTMKVPDAGPYQVGIQKAPIEARMKGYHEVNLCRQGNLAIAGQAPGSERQRFVAGYAGVVLPGEPYELDFVMRPAARIEGQILDEAGTPVLRPHVWLHSDKPLGTTRPYGITQGNGWFTLESIPCGSFWLTNAQTYPASSETVTLARPGTYRVTLQFGQFPSGQPSLRIVAFQTPTFDRSDPAFDQPRVVDPDGLPIAGAQVALCTKDQGVTILDGRLDVNRMGGADSTIVETDDQGRFSFSEEPEAFHLVAAHEKGFAWVTNEEFTALPEVRLQSWGRIEGTLYIGRQRGEEKRMGLMNYINKNAIDQRVRYDYETYTDPNGRFVFDKVPPGWAEVGYLIQVGGPSFQTFTYTARTPLHILPGKTTLTPIGGRGRPVVGKFVPQASYEGPVYFEGGLRALDTVRPERPTPENYEQMTKREQQAWYRQWRETPEAQAYYDAVWHDPQRRHHSFRIQDNGAFSIEDVIPGQYTLTVWLEEPLGDQAPPKEIGAYHGTVEVPQMDEAYSDEPLDLGELVVRMHAQLQVGDVAPLFEEKSSAGNDIRLIDYRGRFVLLSFGYPLPVSELDQIKDLHKQYGASGRLQIIGFKGLGTFASMKEYIRKYEIQWPEIFLSERMDSAIAKQYGLAELPYSLLIDPEGKIVAPRLRGEKLTSTVRNAIGKTD